MSCTPEHDDLRWHALNYRTAHTVHAGEMWEELLACVQRTVLSAEVAERERCAKIFDAAYGRLGRFNDPGAA